MNVANDEQAADTLKRLARQYKLDVRGGRIVPMGNLKPCFEY
jgi:hypothetical protein